ncbi:MAG: hypothetical protein HYY79_08655 [Betaproteobacteria bacterium]|nr:hypothetical protein [Betaproteobacteria bacterium]
MTTAVSGVTGLNLKAVLEGEVTRKLMIRLGSEAIRIGIALGYVLEPVRRLAPEVWLKAGDGDTAALAEVDHAIEVELRRMTDEGYSGTAQDIRKGRRTEVDYMNGFVAARGEEIGIPAPTHKAITALVKRLERGEITQHPDHVTALL